MRPTFARDVSYGGQPPRAYQRRLEAAARILNRGWRLADFAGFSILSIRLVLWSLLFRGFRSCLGVIGQKFGPKFSSALLIGVDAPAPGADNVTLRLMAFTNQPRDEAVRSRARLEARGQGVREHVFRQLPEIGGRWPPASLWHQRQPAVPRTTVFAQAPPVHRTAGA